MLVVMNVRDIKETKLTLENLKKQSGLLFEACTPYYMKIEYQETRIYL